MRTIPSLTAIRGVAALFVVTHHLTEFYRWQHYQAPVTSVLYMGYMGVDLFFVLSGFILTRVHLEMPMNLPSLGGFALRRVLRIYPLHWTVLAAMAILGWFSLIIPRQSLDWQTLPYVAALIQPYLNLSSGVWNGVSWSAGVELSCYIMFPLWLAVMRRSPTAFMMLMVAVAAYAAWRAQGLYAGLWTGMPALIRGWSGFALGASIGLLSSRLQFAKWKTIAIELVSAATLVGAILHKFPPLVPLASGGLIFALQWRHGPINWLLSQKTLVYLGEISFSIYLIQNLVIDIENGLWPVQHFPAITAMFMLREAIMFAALIGISSMTYHFIERPCLSIFRKKKLPVLQASTIALTA
ncbi:MAG: acyltransferase [Acidocella sp.]|nr:acyltransferase [Acidocella sp.]